MGKLICGDTIGKEILSPALGVDNPYEGREFIYVQVMAW